MFTGFTGSLKMLRYRKIQQIQGFPSLGKADVLRFFAVKVSPKDGQEVSLLLDVAEKKPRNDLGLSSLLGRRFAGAPM